MAAGAGMGSVHPGKLKYINPILPLRQITGGFEAKKWFFSQYMPELMRSYL
jgi:hypothetical protein